MKKKIKPPASWSSPSHITTGVEKVQFYENSQTTFYHVKAHKLQQLILGNVGPICER